MFYRRYYLYPNASIAKRFMDTLTNKKIVNHPLYSDAKNRVADVKRGV